MADNTIIFSQPIFVEYIFPALLVFVLVFAILEKTKILGKTKKQINAITALFIALIFLAFPFARQVVVLLIPYLAVSLVVFFIFMLTFGFITNKTKGDVLNKGLKITLGIIAGLGVIVAILWATGAWQKIFTIAVESEYSGKILVNFLLLALIGGAMAVLLATGRKTGTTGAAE
jgi:hypothetical protein